MNTNKNKYTKIKQGKIATWLLEKAKNNDLTPELNNALIWYLSHGGCTKNDE